MVNAKHKDRLFRALFGSEERKESLLSLYNALNGTSYTDTNDIKIYTIDDVIYMGMKNDVSFIISDCLSLYEHQRLIRREKLSSDKASGGLQACGLEICQQ